MPPAIPIFREEQIRSLVTPAVAVAAMRGAFRADGEGRTTVPAVINLQVPGGGAFHVKTASMGKIASPLLNRNCNPEQQTA